MFNPEGQVTAVTNVWDFDDAFSAYAVQGYDSKGDGNPTKEDLQPFAQINLESLAEYHYFTRLRMVGSPVAFGKPKDYFDVFEAEKLTLHFTLPLKKPLDLHGRALQLEVYDPEYFAAITFKNETPVVLVGAPLGCNVEVHRPGRLDASLASKLAAIPADQRTLPPDLSIVTNQLVNAAVVTCR